MSKIKTWADIPECNGMYQASSDGDVRSTDKYVNCKNNSKRKCKSKVLSKYRDSEGYLCVSIMKFGKTTIERVHKLMAMAFLGHKPNGMNAVIDHINGDKEDNSIKNLEVVSHRENISRGKNRKAKKSLFTGLKKRGEKWCASIYFEGKDCYLGTFNDENTAAMAYKTAKNSIENNGTLETTVGKPKGVCYVSSRKKWRAYIKSNYNMIHLGYFDDIQEARDVREIAEQARELGMPIQEYVKRSIKQDK